MAKNLTARYIWLVNTIYKYKRLSLSEINDRWELSSLYDGKEIPRKTFDNHRKAVETLFGVSIECDRRRGYVYYIENSDEFGSNSICKWLLNNYAVSNILMESRSLRERIQLEDIPSGFEFLTSIIEAMKAGREIEITYQGFGKTQHTFRLHPYILKVYRLRWYIVAANPYYDGAILIYALDRIKDLSICEEGFTIPKNFDASSFFKDCFGIIKDEDYDAQKVQIKVFSRQIPYLRSLPLHCSQKEIESSDDYSVFEYFLIPSYDFIQELLWNNEEVEVLNPLWLRKEVAGIISRMNKKYK